jgi:hypothetical protein
MRTPVVEPWASPSKVTALLVAAGLCTAVATPASERAPDVEQVKDLYAEVFVPKADHGSVYVELAELPEQHPLAGLLDEGEHVVRYLLQNGSITPEQREAAAQAPDVAAAYFELLRQDEAFNAAFLEVVDRFLRREGGGIRDYSRVPVRHFSERDVLNTAVRFVYPSGIVDGQLRAYICTGINGLSDARLPRDAFLEALVYSTILGEMHREESPLQARIRSALGLAKSLDLSVDEKTAVARAQGAVWATLRESPELRASVMREHERVGGLLPLDLSFEESSHP